VFCNYYQQIASTYGYVNHVFFYYTALPYNLVDYTQHIKHSIFLNYYYCMLSRANDWPHFM